MKTHDDMSENIETRHYADGASATGPAPLPDHSPHGAQEVPTLPARLRKDAEGHAPRRKATLLEAAARIEALETVVAALTETLRLTSDRANGLERAWNEGFHDAVDASTKSAP